MPEQISLEQVVSSLQNEHRFSGASIAFLKDKGFGEEQFQKLYEVMNLPAQSFAELRKRKTWTEKMIEEGDAHEITAGRYQKNVAAFRDISSEQATVKGRMKFAIEYIIALTDNIGGKEIGNQVIERPFNEEEKKKLRGIYERFCTKDYCAVKIIESKTNHDVVAANTWVAIRGQQEGIDGELLRKIVHFARTSADVDTNVSGELYSRAIGQWASSLGKLLTELEKRARDYAEITCVAETHGQDAQLTTLGHIYANLAEQIRLHAAPLLQADKLKLDGKIAGAIGTDVDMKAAFPKIDFEPMYKDLVEKLFGLKYVQLGNDQDCSNAALCNALDTMVNVGLIVKKAATDIWIYCSRGVLAKMTKKGESGSSAMPQKTNPFFAESAESLTEIVEGMVLPIKKMMVSYREQGDLRRSITKREGYHPIMLSIIAIERLIAEIKNYQPNIAAIEAEIYESGPKVISSALQTYLRERGMPDAYDMIKGIVMKPRVSQDEMRNMILASNIDVDVASQIKNRLASVMDPDPDGLLSKFYASTDPDEQKKLYNALAEANKNADRKLLLGNAIENAQKMADRAKETQALLARYVLN